MTQFHPKSSFLIAASALVLCTLIGAGTASAKDTDTRSNTIAGAAPAALGTLKNRQIVVEPAKPSDAKPTETVENAPAPEADTATEKQTPAVDDGADVTHAPAKEPSQPEASPKTPHGSSYVYVVRYASAYDHGYGHHYDRGYGEDDGYDYAPAGYGHGGYDHCDN